MTVWCELMYLKHRTTFPTSDSPSIFSWLCVLLIFLLPSGADAETVLDHIDFILIQDMQLRKEKEVYFMDVTSVIQNSGNYTLKLGDCRFKLSFVPKDSEEIEVGSVFKEEILLEKKTDSSATDTSVRLSANIGPDIEKFHLNITSSEEMNSLLMDPKPKLNLHIQGGFNLGMGFRQGWVYQSGIKIDWILPVEVVRNVFVDTYKAIELAAGKGGSSDADEEDDFLADIGEESKLLPINKMVVYFSPGKKTLPDKSRKTLEKWMKNLQDTPDERTLHIEGYASGKDSKYSKVLSEERAGVVYDYLSKTLGLKWKNVKVDGFGGEIPVPGVNAKDLDEKNCVKLYFTSG